MSPQLAPAASEAESHSQVIKAQLQLREMILAGELPAGERIAELTVVQRLGMLGGLAAALADGLDPVD